MQESQKIKYFEYFVHKVYEWQDKGDNNDLSVLKLMKLLFFTTAVNSKKETENVLLNTVFNKYVAMPFGHVESVIYNSIKANSELTFYKLSNKKTEKKSEYTDESFSSFVKSLNSSIIDEIDKSIEALKQKNSKIIHYSAFQLVELSHQWYSWRSKFPKLNDITGKESFPISTEIIASEDKYFETQVF
jgi:uncharacterized phage-associated protein